MTFLRLLSREAHQNFTYTCIETVAWEDSNGSLEKALKLLGSDESEFGPPGNERSAPIILRDGCKVNIILKIL